MGQEPDRPITLGDWLTLREEIQAAELLLEEVQIAPTSLETYWSISTSLLALSAETEAHLEEWREHGPAVDEATRYLAAQRRLRAVFATAEEIGLGLSSDEDDEE